MRTTLSEVLKGKGKLKGSQLLDLFDKFYSNPDNKNKVIVGGADYPFIEELVGFSDDTVYAGRCSLSYDDAGRFLFYNPTADLIAELTIRSENIHTNSNRDRFKFTLDTFPDLNESSLFVYYSGHYRVGNSARQLNLGGIIE